MAMRGAPQAGIIELDIHGMTKQQAKRFLESQLLRASKSVYRIKVIHGYNGGTELRDMVRREMKHNKKVIRVEVGLNPGETTLVLRELY